MIKCSTYQGDIRILKLYALNNGVLKYMKPHIIDLQKEIEKSKIIMGEFIMSLPVIEKTVKSSLNLIKKQTI